MENKYLFDTNLEPSEYDVLINPIPLKKTGIILMDKSLNKDEILPYVILEVGSEVKNYKQGDFVYVLGDIVGYPHLVNDEGLHVGQVNVGFIKSKIKNNNEFIKLYNERIDALVAEQKAINERLLVPKEQGDIFLNDTQRREYYKKTKKEQEEIDNDIKLNQLYFKPKNKNQITN
jgi:hypothetical protein